MMKNKIEEQKTTWNDVWKSMGLENEDPGELLKLIKKGK